MKDEKSLRKMITEVLEKTPNEMPLKKIRKNSYVFKSEMAKLPTKEGHKI